MTGRRMNSDRNGWKLGSRQGEVRESRGEVDGLRERK